MRRFRFWRATLGRGTSIDDVLGVKPAGRTIVLSLSAFAPVRIRSGFLDYSPPIERSRFNKAWAPLIRGTAVVRTMSAKNAASVTKLGPRLALEITRADFTEGHIDRHLCRSNGR